MILLVATILLSYVVCVAYDLHSVFQVLRSLTFHSKHSFLPRQTLTTIGKNAFEYAYLISQRLRALHHELSARTLSVPSALVFGREASLVVDGEEGFKHYVGQFFAFLEKKFTASAHLLLLKNAYGEVEVLTATDVSSAIKRFLSLYFDSYYIAASTATHFSHNGFLLKKFGIQRVIAKPCTYGSKKAVLVLLYATTTPLEVEEAWCAEAAQSFSEECARLSQYVGKVKEIAQNRSEIKHQDKIISHISHDIRSPLNNIRSILTLLKRDRTDTEKFIDIASKNCESVTETLETLLDYSAQQAGQIHPNISSFDMRSIAQDIVDAFSITAQLKGITLSLAPGISPFAKADRRHVKRILPNLISNALKYTTAGTVTLDIRQVDAQVVVSIKDSGIGMTQEQCAKLFTPFTRFNEGISDGVGLGLTVTKNLIEVNQGTIQVSSKYGEGTEFLVSFPKTETAPPDSLISSAGIQKKILIADDDGDFVRSLQRILTETGYEVFTAESVQTAVGFLNHESVDVVISDDKMPGGGGEKLIKIIAGRNLRIPFLLLSGSRRSKSYKALHLLTCASSMVKPVAAEEIIGWIEQALCNTRDGTSRERAVGG